MRLGVGKLEVGGFKDRRSVPLRWLAVIGVRNEWRIFILVRAVFHTWELISAWVGAWEAEISGARVLFCGIPC